MQQILHLYFLLNKNINRYYKNDIDKIVLFNYKGGIYYVWT